MKSYSCFPRPLAICLLAAALFCGALATLRAQNNPLITANENGQGSIAFPGGAAFNLTGVLAPDPGPGGLPSALTYSLLGPPGLVAGDLHIFDFGSTILSDIVRFNPAGTGGNPAYPASFVFYSQPGGGQLADTGFPTASYTNIVTLFETLAGDLFYTPTSTQPGFVPGFSVTYHLISSPAGVPENGATLPLLGVGVAGMLVARRYFRQRRR